MLPLSFLDTFREPDLDANVGFHEVPKHECRPGDMPSACAFEEAKVKLGIGVEPSLDLPRLGQIEPVHAFERSLECDEVIPAACLSRQPPRVLFDKGPKREDLLDLSAIEGDYGIAPTRAKHENSLRFEARHGLPERHATCPVAAGKFLLTQNRTGWERAAKDTRPEPLINEVTHRGCKFFSSTQGSGSL